MMKCKSQGEGWLSTLMRVGVGDFEDAMDHAWQLAFATASRLYSSCALPHAHYGMLILYIKDSGTGVTAFAVPSAKIAH